MGQAYLFDEYVGFGSLIVADIDRIGLVVEDKRDLDLAIGSHCAGL